MAHDSVRPEAPSTTKLEGRGFLPLHDPLRALPHAYALWEDVAAELPKLLVAGRTRRVVDRMAQLDPSALQDGPELRRAMLLLSFIGHAYVWERETAARVLPAAIAVPWHAVATRLGRPPVLSYASYALDNWRRFDASEPIALGNLALLHTFLGGADEEWFITVHIDIEARAAAALDAVALAQQAASALDRGALTTQLRAIAVSLEGIVATLGRMPEFCDPRGYYLRVRPFIHGWKNHPALPDGLVYEGVAAYGGVPQRFRGETGAQSSIVPALDALLGIAHHPDPLREYLMEMREYMPLEHRAFIAAVEQGADVRTLALAGGPAQEAYDACVEQIRRFRALHLQYAASYIHNQAPKGDTNPTDVGTGGTPFMRYLKKHEDETAQSLSTKGEGRG